jgi:hypothetical protein
VGAVSAAVGRYGHTHRVVEAAAAHQPSIIGALLAGLPDPVAEPALGIHFLDEVPALVGHVECAPGPHSHGGGVVKAHAPVGIEGFAAHQLAAGHGAHLAIGADAANEVVAPVGH